MALGTWGGEHVGLTVTARGARVEFDCAHGSINQRLRLDRAKRFDVRGVFVAEHGGPVREGERPDSRPARYTGQVVGQTMTLTVTLEGENRPLGAFTLRRGQPPGLTKCL